VPALSSVTVLPLMVHTLPVKDAKLTVSPEEAVALIPKGATPKVLSLSAAKLMVWAKPATLKLRVTVAAASQ